MWHLRLGLCCGHLPQLPKAVLTLAAHLPLKPELADHESSRGTQCSVGSTKRCSHGQVSAGNGEREHSQGGKLNRQQPEGMPKRPPRDLRDHGIRQ